MPDYDFAGNDDPECIIANMLDNGEQAKLVMQAFADLGFVVLPKEPTQGMIDAGSEVPMESACKGDPLFDFADAAGIYRAMIAAWR